MILEAVLLQMSFLICLIDGENMKDHALFYRMVSPGKKVRESKRVDTMDARTVEDILSWLQNRYKEVNRKTRNEDLSRAYLPANFGSTTQEPRPFQTQFTTNGRTTTQPPTYTQVYQQPSTNQNYNPQSSSYQPPPSSYQPPPSSYQPPVSSYQPPPSSYQPPVSSYQPPVSSYQPPSSSYQPSPSSYQPPPTSYQPPYSNSAVVTNPTIQQTGQELQPQSGQQIPQTGQPQQGQQQPQGGQQLPQSVNELSGRHPPHIHALNVDCSKDKMVINLEFNENFNGIIYSKGYHNSPECRYVQPNSNQNRYSFTLLLNSCGTQFIDGFSTGNNAYLENTLVIQNEPGILEVWDSIRSVRCLWEGSIDQKLNSGLSIGSLNQELVTFSGDTGRARLEIQAGRGPYSYGATNLVQIGDLMTVVLTVEGDNSFELRVGDCIGTDGRPDSGNVIQLTDSRGCPLKDKLMAGFQYSRHQQTGSAIAYAYFRAFKFPDVMDLTMECNVQLCKTECRQPCDDPNQKFEPSRKRRSVNSTDEENDDVHLTHTIRVFIPQDLSEVPALQQELSIDHICLTRYTFYSTTLSLSLLCVLSGISTVYYWMKNHRKTYK